MPGNVSDRCHTVTMPGFPHEIAVEIFQNEPKLVLKLLAHVGANPDLGHLAAVNLADSNLSDRDPEKIKNMFADNVFVFRGSKRTIAVVAEVQTSDPDHERELKWPAYAANARVRHDCDTYLLVFATSREAAAGSARAIVMGHPGWEFAPLVTGFRRTPGISDEDGACTPELTLLRIITGDHDLGTHDGRMFALAAIRLASASRLERYTRYLKRLAPPQAQRALEDLMETVWKDDFVDGWLDQGRLMGVKEKLLRLLEKRLSMSEAARERVEKCSDIATIDAWFDRAITAETLAEVFAKLQPLGTPHGPWVEPGTR